MTVIRDPHDLNRIWEELLSGATGTTCFSGLWGGSRAWILAQLMRELPYPLLILTSTPSEAERVYNDLKFFLAPSNHDRENLPEPCLFPQWEILPFDDKSPHPEIVKQRLNTLSRLLSEENLITITTIRAILQRLLPRDVLHRGTLDFSVGDIIDLDHLCREISSYGYHRTDLVEVPGDYCRRGGIIDLYPPTSENPIRLEFFDNEIESIRFFSAEDQRSIRQINRVQTILPREILLDPPAMEHFRKKTGGSPHPLDQELSTHEIPEGTEFYAPLFNPSMETLFDYLPDDTVVVLDSPEEVDGHAQSFRLEIEERYAMARQQGRMPCEISELYIHPDELKALIDKRNRLSFAMTPQEGEKEVQYKTESIGSFTLPGQSRISSLIHAIREMKKDGKICIAVRTQVQANRLMELLSREEKISCERFQRFSDLPDQKGALGIVTGSLSRGFRFPLFGLTCITEDEIFGVKRVQRPTRPTREGPFLTSLSELKTGDFVVHLDHGIGRYRGLHEICVERIDQDLIRVEYAGGDLLYVPPDKLHLIQKYTGSEGHSVQLNRLGGTGWEKLKGRIKKSIEEMSRELIELYAKRKIAKGTSFSTPDSLFLEFEETFEYEETPDQQKAIEEVLEDMQKPEPMDRLVCGDVGYGKTEVAIRAAFKAVLDGKQVAILVPTTLLAQQHNESFRRRFRSFPVEAEMLSRFKSRGEQKKILERLRQGQVDILIGTHRLLSKDVTFKDLGLVVIDEEQRFGVRHKEKLKQLRTDVDVLTLTATPIPRTLEMSFLGIRNISIINTPPEDRLSIYTKVARFSEEMIREAVLRELDRGGQIFFVHNRVRDIDSIADFVRKVVPEARIDVAHGQMEEQSLKEVMFRFLDQEIDLLVTTSIIESGLDIPNANTMIIHKPEEFGLAQLYQLRGRIGRTHHRAFAYLLTRAEKSMSREARQRLQVIQELTELGSGFQLAARDLEIRGAGNLLGPQQSGNIAALGFDLYLQLVDEVVSELKGEKRIQPVEPTIHMKVTARIPKHYIREDRLRLDFYRRLAGLEEETGLFRIVDEIRDRFGSPPNEVENLFKIIELKILAKRLQILEIIEKERSIRFTFHSDTPVPQDRIIQLVHSYADRIRVTSEFQLEITRLDGGFNEVWAQTKNLLQELV